MKTLPKGAPTTWTVQVSISHKKQVQPLSLSEVNQALKGLPSWSIAESTVDCPYPNIQRHWMGSSFLQTFSVMTSIAMIAEQLNHHPYWSNAYRRLQIRLTTHDAKGITDQDITLAHQIEDVLTKHTP